MTNYITERPWLDTITAWYVHVDDAYVRLVVRRGYPLRTSGPEPMFSDSEVITVSLIIGDKGYVDADLEERLWLTRRIHLLPLHATIGRSNGRTTSDAFSVHVRHRVETVFSIWTTVFNVERPRGRSLAGHVVRIATCILAHTLSFFLA